MSYPTRARISELLSYDADTGLFTWRVSRGNRSAGSTAGSLDQNGYIYIAIDKKDYGAHRLAWIYVHGSNPEADIDHINLVKNDNRLSNLRCATRSQNCANISRKRNNTTGYKGVYRVEYRGVRITREYYYAKIRVMGVDFRLGVFSSAEDAAAAYAAASKEKFGDFSNTG